MAHLSPLCCCSATESRAALPARIRQFSPPREKRLFVSPVAPARWRAPSCSRCVERRWLSQSALGMCTPCQLLAFQGRCQGAFRWVRNAIAAGRDFCLDQPARLSCALQLGIVVFHGMSFLRPVTPEGRQQGGTPGLKVQAMLTSVRE